MSRRIEQLIPEELEYLGEPGEFRWHITDEGYFGVVEIQLQRKGWLRWRDVEHAYPQMWDRFQDADLTSASAWEGLVNAGKDECLYRVVNRRETLAAKEKFLHNA